MAPDIECEMSLENVHLQKGPRAMAKLSPKRESVPLLAGLILLARGKVRDSYLLPDGEHILQVATDGQLRLGAESCTEPFYFAVLDARLVLMNIVFIYPLLNQGEGRVRSASD